MHTTRRIIKSAQIPVTIMMALLAAEPTWAGTPITYEQNANGQAYSYTFPGGVVDSGNFPNNNNWNQQQVVSIDNHGNQFVSQPSNWSTTYYPGSSSDPTPTTDDVDLGANLVNLNLPITVNSLNLDSGGTFNIGSALSVSGNLTNNGAINLTGSMNFNGGALLGNGSISMANDGHGDQSVISGTLTQSAGLTILGTGVIDAALTNNGAVEATTSTLTLQTSSMINNNLFEATGGRTLLVDGITVSQRSSGQLLASGSGSVVELLGATIQGGALNTASGGVIEVVSGSSISGVTNNGTFNVSSALSVPGDLTNNGAINLTGSMNFNGGALLGNGSISMANDGHGDQSVISGTLTQSAGLTILGTGVINAALTNNGAVEATTSTLTLQTSSMINNNLFEATGGRTLLVDGITVTQGSSGQLLASGSGSVVELLGATIQGGALNTASGGVIEVVSGSSISGVTNNGTFNISSALSVPGDLTNNGAINLTGSMNFNGGALLGNGSITMAGDGRGDQSVISGTLTQPAGHTILGTGVINAALTNNGAVEATTGTLTLQTNHMTNNGLMQATGGHTLQFATGVLTNLNGTTLTGGAFEVDAGSTMVIPGSIVTNAASIVLGGAGTSFTALNALTSNAGSLTLDSGASFSRSASVNNSGSIVLTGGGTLSLTGLALTSASTLEFDLNGLTQGTQYGRIKDSGALTVAGTLRVQLSAGFSPQFGNSFDLLDWGNLTGNFRSILLPTLPQGLEWDTTQLYTTGKISVVPEPGSFVMALLGCAPSWSSAAKFHLSNVLKDKPATEQ